MGSLEYAQSTPIIIEDRALAHLKVVITTKLRRNESFTFSIKHQLLDGRDTIWLHPSIPIRFTFDSPEPPELNGAWLTELMNSASTTGGVTFIDEVLSPVEPTDSGE